MSAPWEWRGGKSSKNISPNGMEREWNERKRNTRNVVLCCRTINGLTWKCMMSEAYFESINPTDLISEIVLKISRKHETSISLKRWREHKGINFKFISYFVRWIRIRGNRWEEGHRELKRREIERKRRRRAHTHTTEREREELSKG